MEFRTEGRFVEPDRSLDSVPFDELHKRLDITIMSGHRADLATFGSTDIGFLSLISKIKVHSGYEDQCTAKYYGDMYDIVANLEGEVDRIVEAGIFMGGSSVILAGCAERIDAELVMIDIDERYLQFGYQRLIRSFPDAASRVKLYLGDLPVYVRDVLIPEQSQSRLLVHHDAGHAFHDLIRDLGALSFVKDRLLGVMVQDTHLRGPPKGMRFVDLALLGIFGTDMQFIGMGSVYTEEEHPELLVPNQYAGGYFLPDKLEGMYVPMSHNSFEYPHPRLTIDQFFW